MLTSQSCVHQHLHIEPRADDTKRPLGSEANRRTQDRSMTDLQTPLIALVSLEARDSTLAIDGLEKARDRMHARSVVNRPEARGIDATSARPSPHLFQSHR